MLCFFKISGGFIAGFELADCRIIFGKWSLANGIPRLVFVLSRSDELGMNWSRV
jgi:hypothetical protein